MGLAGTVMTVEYGQYVAARVPAMRERIRREGEELVSILSLFIVILFFVAGQQLSAWLLMARDAAGRVGRAALLCVR
jgi:hypothetical protein